MNLKIVNMDRCVHLGLQVVFDPTKFSSQVLEYEFERTRQFFMLFYTSQVQTVLL